MVGATGENYNGRKDRVFRYTDVAETMLEAAPGKCYVYNGRLRGFTSDGLSIHSKVISELERLLPVSCGSVIAGKCDIIAVMNRIKCFGLGNTGKNYGNIAEFRQVTKIIKSCPSLEARELKYYSCMIADAKNKMGIALNHDH